MNIIETGIKDLLVLEPKVFEDNRGYFFECFNEETLKNNELNYHFVQDNQSRSSYGVIRGLHYQLIPEAMAKLVRVLEGKIFDVAVDIRKNSSTFGKWFGIELSADNKKQLLIPRGFAHGFSVLSEYATVFYKCDYFYRPNSERGIIYNDNFLNIDWRIPANDATISERDKKMNTFDKAEMNF